MKIINKICAPSRWKQYLLTGLLINGLLSFLVQAMIFFIGKKGLSVGLSLGIDAGGMLIGLVFILLAFISYRKLFATEHTSRDMVFRWWNNGVMLLVCVVLLKLVPMLLWQYVGLLSPVAGMISAGIFVLLVSIITVRQLILFVVDLQVENEFAQKKFLFKKVLRKPVIILVTLAVCLWFTLGEGAVNFLFGIVALRFGNSFALQIIHRLLLAVVDALVIGGYLAYVNKVREVVYQEEMPVREAKLKLVPGILVCVVTLVLLVYAGANVINVLDVNKPERVDDYIVELMDAATKEIDYKRTDEAIRIYVQVEEYLAALGAYVEEDNAMVLQYMTTNIDDEFLWRLYYTLTGNPYFAREELLKSGKDTRLCHDILRSYADGEGEDEDEDSEFNLSRREKKALIKDCLWICLSEGAFVDSTIKFDEDSLRKKTVNDMNKDYRDTLIYNDLMAVLQASSANGRMDTQTVNKLLELANANPENMLYQLMAVMGGAQLLSDSAKHYGKVVECAKRLDAMLVEENRDVEDIVEEKLYLAQMMLNCENYTTALDFLDEVRLLGNTDVEDAILICYQKKNDNENTIKYVEELRGNGEDRAMLDYFMALAYLKSKNVDEALKNGVMLADKAVAAGEDREDVSALLYSLVEYMCISDSYRDYIDYYYRIKTYTEEQLAILAQSTLLFNYIQAMNAVYNSRDYALAISSLEAVEAELPGLSKTWYLKGTAYFDMREYDSAIECFNKCIAIDEDNITATYSLAALYDKKGEYEKAYMLCEQILAVLPEVNHDKDWYGIAYHANALYGALKKHVGGTK